VIKNHHFMEEADRARRIAELYHSAPTPG